MLQKNRGCPFAIRSLRNGPTNCRNTTKIPLFLGYLIQISDKCTIYLSFFVLLTQYAFILTFIISLKHHDRKINMLTTFVVKKIYASENTHVFTELPAAPRTICRFRLLCIFLHKICLKFI